MICEPGAIAVVPLPFSDLPVAKPRPALVLSSETLNAATGQTVMAMVTTAGRSRWPNDVPLSDLTAAGLREPCVVRWKLFSIDNRLIARTIGQRGIQDRLAAKSAATALIAL